MSVDPYKYFRLEARDLADQLGKGLMALEGDRSPELLPRLLRLAHTLKGAARVVRQTAIAEQAHTLEEALLPLKDPAVAVPEGLVDRALKVMDAISAAISALESPPAAAAPAPAREPVEESFGTLRVEIGEMDRLLNRLTEANVYLSSVRRVTDDLVQARRAAVAVRHLASERSDSAASSPALTRLSALSEELEGLVAGIEQRLSSAIDRTERELSEGREAAERLRLLPANLLASSLARTARDVAQASGKLVSVETKGEDVRLDAQVLARVRDALIQLVRNAVAHGIEPQAERVRAGKPPAGRVEIEISHRGGRAAFVCRDDGGGIDLDAVKRAAEKRGVSLGEALDANALVQLLLRGGVTTADTVTEMSGRGIGLDVVRTVAADLGGNVAVRTERGRGTEFELVVPLSLVSVDALVMEAGGYRAVVPLDSVRRVVRLTPGTVAQTAKGRSVVHEGNVIPFVPLSRWLRGKQLRPAGSSAVAIVVEGASSLAAIGVDRLLGTSNVVVHPVPPLTPVHAVVGGICRDAEGTPQVVLEPGALASSARELEAEAPAGEKTERPRPILVIDDSLTTRMLEQSILESAGYEVDLASSAEAALEKASQQSYALFLVDVEMPGMDGFTFVSTTRADPSLRATPAILVSSRNAPEDLQRGRDAGAAAYIVKGDFDQNRLLETIRRLVGTGQRAPREGGPIGRKS